MGAGAYRWWVEPPGPPKKIESVFGPYVYPDERIAAEYRRMNVDSESRMIALMAVLTYARKIEWKIMHSINRWRRREGLEPLPVNTNRGPP